MLSLNSSLELGECVNSLTGNQVGERKKAIQFKPEFKNRKQCVYSCDLIEESKISNQNTQFANSLQFPFVTPAVSGSISGKLSVSKETRSKSYSIICSIDCFIIDKAKVFSGAKDAVVTLKPDALNLLKKDYRAFYNQYGDCYVAEVCYGKKFNFKINFSMNTFEKRDALKMALKAQVEKPELGFSGDFSKFLKKEKIRYNIDVSSVGIDLKKLGITDTVQNLDELKIFLQKTRSSLAEDADVESVPLYSVIKGYDVIAKQFTKSLGRDLVDAKRILSGIEDSREILDFCSKSIYQNEQSKQDSIDKSKGLKEASNFIYENIVSCSPDDPDLKSKLDQVKNCFDDVNMRIKNFENFYKPSDVRATLLTEFKLRPHGELSLDKVDLDKKIDFKLAKALSFKVSGITAENKSKLGRISFGYYESNGGFKEITSDIMQENVVWLTKEVQEKLRNDDLKVNYRWYAPNGNLVKQFPGVKITLYAHAFVPPEKISDSPVLRMSRLRAS